MCQLSKRTGSGNDASSSSSLASKYHRSAFVNSASSWTVCILSLYHLFVSFFLPFQLICQGMTTNEKMNAHRYEHFLKMGGLSPFQWAHTDTIYYLGHQQAFTKSYPLFFLSQGACANCADFFGFTSCTKSNKKVDWTRTYDVPTNLSSSVPEAKDPRADIKIPMPYTSSHSSQYSYSKESLQEPSNPLGRPRVVEMTEPMKQS